MSVRIKTFFCNAMGFILGPLQLLHLSSYNRQYFGDFTPIDTIFAVIMVCLLLLIPPILKKNLERWLKLIIILTGLFGFLSYLFAPAISSVQNTRIILVFSQQISIFMWLHMIQIVLSGWMFCLILILWAGESLSLKTPFKVANHRKYLFGPIWESELIGSWLLGLGVYIGAIMTLPQITSSIYLFSSLISMLWLVLILVSKTESKDPIYYLEISTLKKVSSLELLVGPEKASKIFWIFIEWIIFTLLLAAYGFAFFQVLKSLSEFTRLLLFIANFGFGGLIVMMLSLNSNINSILKRFGLIIGGLGVLRFYGTLQQTTSNTQTFDFIFGFCLFSLVWGYLNRVFRTPFPSASGILPVSFIVMGYTLLIPAYTREIVALIPTIQAISTFLIIFELISFWFRDSSVPTAWQLQDRIENHPTLDTKTDFHQNDKRGETK